MITIKILTGSNRPGRFNIQPATWIFELAKKRSEINVELVDLAEVNLPLLDEANPPMMHQYEHEHTKQWSASMAEADGYLFVTPEYNHGVSPILKNAVDYLNQEWGHKPVSFVSYGSLAGGARAVEHWRGIVGEVRMYDLREQLLLPNYWEELDEKGNYKFNDRHEKHANLILDELIFWATELKASRERLVAKNA